MPKLLGEFLQEQQEPFALEVYLHERGYLRATGLNTRYSLCSSAKLSKSSASCSIKKRSNAVPNCSDFLKGILCQFVAANNDQQLTNSGNDSRKNSLTENSKRRPYNAAEERSSSSSTTLFNCYSEIHVGGTHCPKAVDIRRFVKCGDLFLEREVGADTKLKWRAEEDIKQLSPVSVLEETESDEVSPIHNTQGESSNPISSQCNLKQPTHYSIDEFKEVVGLSSNDQCIIIHTRALHQRKQILFDCVQEEIEKHSTRDKSREELKKILGDEELRKLDHENVRVQSQDSINESNIVHQSLYNLLASADEWKAEFEQQKMELSMEIENAILDDVINAIITW